LCFFLLLGSAPPGFSLFFWCHALGCAVKPPGFELGFFFLLSRNLFFFGVHFFRVLGGGVASNGWEGGNVSVFLTGCAPFPKGLAFWICFSHRTLQRDLGVGRYLLGFFPFFFLLCGKNKFFFWELLFCWFAVSGGERGYCCFLRVLPAGQQGLFFFPWGFPPFLPTVGVQHGEISVSSLATNPLFPFFFLFLF